MPLLTPLRGGGLAGRAIAGEAYGVEVATLVYLDGRVAAVPRKLEGELRPHRVRRPLPSQLHVPPGEARVSTRGGLSGGPRLRRSDPLPLLPSWRRHGLQLRQRSQVSLRSLAVVTVCSKQRLQLIVVEVVCRSQLPRQGTEPREGASAVVVVAAAAAVVVG